MRLISNNFSQDSDTIVTSSSESPYYPVSNIKHEHRAKEWRSSGHFKITTLNADITIDGVLHNIAEGSYSPAELVEALNTLSTPVFSYNYNTFKFSVETTVTITGSLLALMEFSPTVSANATANLAKLHTSEYLTFDLRTTEDINSLILLWGKGDYRLSTSAEVRLKASATLNFDSPAVDIELTLNNDYEIASHYFSTTQSYRYWRIEIIDPQNSYGFVNLGVVVLGKSEDLDLPEAGWSFNVVDTSDITITAFGQIYVDEYPTLNQLNLDFKVIDDVTTQAFINLFSSIGNRKPIFVAIDPESAAFNKDLFCIYGRMQNQLQIQNIVYKNFNTSLTITECN